MEEVIRLLQYSHTTDDPRAAVTAFVEAKCRLPGCVTSDELMQLSDTTTLPFNCLRDNCDTTCGTVLGNLLFPLFLVTTNFILLNLVIGVAVDKIGNSKWINRLLSPILSNSCQCRLRLCDMPKYAQTSPGLLGSCPSVPASLLTRVLHLRRLSPAKRPPEPWALFFVCELGTCVKMPMLLSMFSSMFLS